MSILRCCCIVTLLLIGAGEVAYAADDDARWIERYMDRQAATHASATAQPIAFAALQTHVGDRVRLRLRDGRVRSGRVDRVGSDHVQLANRLVGGEFKFRVPRGEIAGIELEVGR